MTEKKGVKFFTVSQLAELVGAELIGDGSVEISGFGALKTAGAADISFINEEKYFNEIAASNAGAVIINKRIDAAPMPLLLVKNVDAAVVEVLGKFMPSLKAPVAGIHTSAVVEEGAFVDPSASVGPLAFIASGVKIGARTVVSPGCNIGQDTNIGSDCKLESNVVVYHNCRIGNNCVIGANTTIGSVGFGYAFIDGQHRALPHTGGVVIEDFVDVGAGCCIDRAKFGNTIIGAGTKMDNLIQVGHNVVIGKFSLVVAQVGIGGSSRIGNGVVLAGQVGIRNHVKIGDGAKIGAQAGVAGDIAPNSESVGSPAIDVRDKLKQIMVTQKLPAMSKQLKQLIKKVEKLEAAKDNS